MHIVALSAALLTAATVVVAQDQGGRPAWNRGVITFGCWPTRPTPQDATTPYYQTGNAASIDACAANCAVQRPQDPAAPLFWYHQPSTQICWCGNWYQRPTQQSTANIPCTSTANLWAYGRISTTFTNFGTSSCRTRAQVGLANSAFSASNVQVGPAGCMRQCRSNRFAYWWSDNTNNNFRCGCSDNIQTGVGQAATCAPGTVFVWEHSVQAQASALDRRKRRAALENQEPVDLCPAGLSSCAIRDSRGRVIPGAFECIDTRSELESCGGCIGGYMHYNGTVETNTKGVNCDTISGAATGVGCFNGKCHIASCQRGWNLLDGVCVRS